MKKTLIPGATPASWDSDALYNKAVRYAQNMSERTSDEWEYALWSSFVLEALARSALSNVSPTLLADTERGWSSLYHSLGFKPIEEKFTPKSIAISEVFKRLSLILDDFTREHENFAIVHTGRRNSELHSGEAAFEGIKGSVWQSRYYQICEVLLASLGMTLENFVGTDETKIARQLIAAAADDSAKAVKGDVEAHKKVWLGKTADQREKLIAQASLWSTRYNGHRVECLACGSAAVVTGDPVGPLAQKLREGEITETQEYLPNQFECVACGLKVAGLSRLSVVGMGDRYKKTQIYDAAEYYAPEDEYPEYEEDNNEP